VRGILSGRNVAIGIALLLVVIASRILFPVPLPNIQLPAERLPNYPITNTFVATLLADVTLLVLAAIVMRNLEVEPQGLDTLGGKVANLIEWGIEGFDNLAHDIAGENASKFFPIFMSIFLFLLVANWYELVPGIGSIGFLESPQEARGTAEGQVTSGEQNTTYKLGGQIGPIGLISTERAEPGQAGYILVPFARTATTDLNLPLGLALISMTYIQIMGIRSLGLGYFRKFFVNPVRDLIGSFVGLLELISEFAKVISLTFRLFGNLFAGEVLLAIIPFLLPFLVPLPFYGLELFVGFMQAFVFAILTLIFTSQAVISHGGHQEEHS
jgi:F-type H+-transporting ATPase subunit a